MDLALSRGEVLDHWRAPALVAGGALVGALAWRGVAAWLPLAFLLPALWGLAERRSTAGLVALAYYLLAARDIPAGARVFFESGWDLGIALWLGASVLLALPWYALHGATWRPVRALLALALVSLPPIGIVGWANPLTGIGMLLPGTAWWGLLLGLALLAGAARWPWVALAMTAAAVITPREPVKSPTGWRAFDTHWQMTSGAQDYTQQYERHQALAARVRNDNQSSVLVFPETILGRWNAPSAWIWADTARQASERGQRLILGAEVARGRYYENVAGSITANGDYRPLYRQLMPVPLSMWRPGTGGGALPAWWARQSATIDEKKTAFLICYEQLLLWPPLVAMATDPEVLVGLSNDWWARDTRIPAIQRASLEAWARLFGVRLVIAQNL